MATVAGTEEAFTADFTGSVVAAKRERPVDCR